VNKTRENIGLRFCVCVMSKTVSHHSLLLELNGSERLVIAFALSSFKNREYYRPNFLLWLSAEILASLAYGASITVQWITLLVSLIVIHESDSKDANNRKVSSSDGMFTSNRSSSSNAGESSFWQLPSLTLSLLTGGTDGANSDVSSSSAASGLTESYPSPQLTGSSQASNPALRRRKHGDRTTKSRRVTRAAVG